MAKPQSCPHCLVVASVYDKYNFDEEGNLLCPKCEQIIYAVDEKSESVVDNVVKESVTTFSYSSYVGNYSGNFR